MAPSMAHSHSDGTLSVGVATASSPAGPFTDIGKPLVHTPGTGALAADVTLNIPSSPYALL